jgi:succinoglycan biosynthesis transport protein ExoP
MMMTPETEPFADEIDLREYLQVILNHWSWIVLATIVGAAIAGALSFFVISPTYEATALVAITPPKYLMQFSPEFQALAQERLQTEIYGTYPELVRSDELLQQVIDSLTEDLGTTSLSLESLRNKISVRASKGVGLIYLSVKDNDPEKAASLANTLAELYVQTLNGLYSNPETEYEFFATQLVEAKSDLETAQEALAAFKARDPSALLSSELKAQIDALNDLLAAKNSIQMQEQTIESWRQQLSLESNGSTVSRADELTAFLMQLEAFGVMKESVQPQFQVSLEQIAEEWSVAEQIAYLNSLKEFLRSRAAEIDIRVAELQPEILRLQQDLQAATNEEERLSQEVTIASSVHESLALKAEEARITSESQAGIAQLASKAAVPKNPVAPRKLLNVAMGAALGLIAGLALAVLLELLRVSHQSTGDRGSDDGS